MIADTTLAFEIISETDELRDAYPKGATPHDLAGWFGQPISRVEDAIASMRKSGSDLSFLREGPAKNPAAVEMGRAGGRARAEKIEAERRTEIAREAAAKRWTRGPYTKRPVSEPTGKEFRNSVIKALPHLAKQYPTGVTVRGMIDFFNADEAQVRYLLNQARNERWCKVIRTRTEARGRQVVYLFDGMIEGPPEMTERQAQVYQWLAARTDDDGEVTAPMNEMSRDLKMSDGTAFGHIGCLSKKGYLERLTPLSARDENGVPISPRFAVYEAREPAPVDLPQPKLDESDKHPSDRTRGYSVFLEQLVAHRNSLQRDLDGIDAIISKYFGAKDVERAMMRK
jgi:hypothetical protein